MEDITSLTGVAGLVNPANTNNELDLNKIEEEIINGNITMRQVPQEDAFDEYMRELESSDFEDEVENPMMYEKPQYVFNQESELPFTSQEDIYNYVRPAINPHDKAMSSFTNQQYEQLKSQKLQEEEKKTRQLEDIMELRYELESEGMNTDSIPSVNKYSTAVEVDRVHKMIKKRYTRLRCETLGNECILSLVQLLEVFFDGEKSYFGFKPVLTGWHNTVRGKLHKMRYETSTVANDVMDAFNIGAAGRILLELGPSAFIYSSSKKRQSGQSNFVPTNFNKKSEALDDLYEMDK